MYRLPAATRSLVTDQNSVMYLTVRREQDYSYCRELVENRKEEHRSFCRLLHKQRFSALGKSKTEVKHRRIKQNGDISETMHILNIFIKRQLYGSDCVITNRNTHIFAEGSTFRKDTESHAFSLNQTSKAQV